MPDPSKAFGGSAGKLGTQHPPVAAARQLMMDLYFDDECIIIKMQAGQDTRGAYTEIPAYSEPKKCHITRVENQRGAFTQGSTSPGGHGPVTSASIWFVHVEANSGITVGDKIQNSKGEVYDIVAVDDSETWRVMDSFRGVLLGVNQ